MFIAMWKILSRFIDGCAEPAVFMYFWHVSYGGIQNIGLFHGLYHQTGLKSQYISPLLLTRHGTQEAEKKAPTGQSPPVVVMSFTSVTLASHEWS